MFVNMNHNLISVIAEHAFDGLGKLEILDMSENSVSHLTAEMFYPLSRCVNLSLKKNQISIIDRDAFKGLSNAEHHDLHYNNIVEIGHGAFYPLVSLDVIAFFGQKMFPEIVPSTFLGLQSLKKDVFGYTSIGSLGANVFSTLINCREFHLSSNKITVIHEDAFKGMWSLNDLKLGRNLISVLPAKLFQNSKGMFGIQLDYNKLTFLPSGMFADLHALRFLDLHGNQLRTIESSCLSHYPILQLKLLLHDPNIQQPVLFDCYSLCWLKKREQLGRILWSHVDPTIYYKPQCADGVNWDTLDPNNATQCPQEGKHSITWKPAIALFCRNIYPPERYGLEQQ